MLPPKNKRTLIAEITFIFFSLLIFLLSIDLLGGAFEKMSGGLAGSILNAASNPFISLFMGLLITALLQSSSTTTSMIVALVASGALSLTNAMPMVMGANIGTTLTSTIVSLGYITKNKQFRKAISAATVHDFFNIILVVILFPLEYYYGTLSFLSKNITGLITPAEINGQNVWLNGDILFTRPLSQWIIDLINNNLISLALAIILLFASIKILSKFIYRVLIGDSQAKFNQYIFKNPLKSFGWGTLITAGIQSSSVTTSLIVPFVATGKVSLKKAFPFIMGANIGTTITALLAALFKSDAAISIAIAHLLFNTIGVLLFLPFKPIRRLPVLLALRFGGLTLKYRIIGFIYIIITFFLIPFLLIYFSS